MKRMANLHPSLDIICYILSLFLVFLALLINPTYADHDTAMAASPTELVDEVCNRTSNYTFCVSALYSDPRTPDADRYTLAYISFRLAYLDASTTLKHITHLLKNSSSGHDYQNLQRCQRDYKNGVQNLESAFNDLDSETFFTLPRYANDTARVAEDCEAHYPPLNSVTLKFLCEICVVISKLFTGSS